MNYYQSITRKAILIGSPGPFNNFLKGVKQDLANMRRFLQSDKGGAWRPNEIKELSNPTYHQVMDVVSDANQDYVVVYFSGHGFTDQVTNGRMIALKDCSISDLNLLNRSPRQLVIVDACRSYIAPGLSGTPDFGDMVDHFDGGSVHDLFNEYIAHSPAGKLIVHATQPGKYSYDSLKGGAFSQALLQVSTRMMSENDYAPCSIQGILNHTAKVLRSKTVAGNFQIPQITYVRGEFNVPFALSIPSHTKVGAIKIKSGSQLSGSEAAVLSICALVVVGLAVSASS